MRAACGGVGARRIEETPFAVIDFETTGLTPGLDRVIEIAVVKLEPGQKPKLVFETLVNPQRPVAATEIHGITDADVADAPVFSDIAGDLVDALSGCVVTAYNVYFDIKFLTHELALAGPQHTPPHCCLMYFRPLLGLGPRCRLDEACATFGIKHDASHMSAADALASVELLTIYLVELKRRAIQCFNELSALGTYKFLSSFANEPLGHAAALNLHCGGRRKARSSLSQSQPACPAPAADDPKIGIRKYWETLKAAVADLHITPDEIAAVHQIREQFQLKQEQVRALHARAYASVIAQFVQDQWLDEQEEAKLRKFHHCLAELGWAPGQ